LNQSKRGISVTLFPKPVIIMVLFLFGILFSITALTKSNEASELPHSKEALGVNPIEHGECSVNSIELELKTLFDLHQQSRDSGARCGSNKMPSVASLRWSCELANDAEKHVNDMAKNAFMAHKGSDGKTIGKRATEANYIWRNIAENVAEGVEVADKAYRLWIKCACHCGNILNPKYTELGAAKAGDYWVVMFGRR
jgi:uncharacterized protein YkwD